MYSLNICSILIKNKGSQISLAKPLFFYGRRVGVAEFHLVTFASRAAAARKLTNYHLSSKKCHYFDIFYSSSLSVRTFHLQNYQQKSLHKAGFFVGRRVGVRTPDPLIKSQLLYQLSYAPISHRLKIRRNINRLIFFCKSFFTDFAKISSLRAKG